MPYSSPPSEVISPSPYIRLLTSRRYTKALDHIRSIRHKRVTELKGERDHLGFLSREKDLSETLAKRISCLNSVITAKELEYGEVKYEYGKLVQANKKLYEQGTRFREMYAKFESLQEKKTRYEEDLAGAKENLQVVLGLECRSKVYPLS